MIVIPAVTEGDALRPAEDLAAYPSALCWVCDGKNYTGYEPGDDMPAAPQEGASS